eukprot:9259614-Alexandrium_andersonii.AAC.1
MPSSDDESSSSPSPIRPGVPPGPPGVRPIQTPAPFPRGRPPRSRSRAGRGRRGPDLGPLLVWRPGGTGPVDLPPSDCRECGRHTTVRCLAMGPRCRICHAAWLLRRCL